MTRRHYISPSRMREIRAELAKEAKFCNCAECGVEILSTIAYRMKGRPYCPQCTQPKYLPETGCRASKDDISPWQENNIRIMEGD